MIYRELGKTGMMVSQLSFGCIPILKGEISILPHYYGRTMTEALEIMEAAYALGVNLYDTAVVPEYGDAEIKLGEFIKRHPDIIVSDKARAYSGEDMQRALETSIKNLGRSCCEIYFVHQVAPENEEETFEEGGALDALAEAKARGDILYTGIATHHYDVALRAARDPRVDVIQIPGNILERGLLDQMKDEPAFEGKGILLCKVFAAGILPDYFDVGNLIDHALSYPVSSVILGFGSVGQVMQGIDEKRRGIPYSFEKTIRQLERFYEVIPCDRCQRCSCAGGIEIASLFRYYNYYHLGHRNWARERLLNLTNRFVDPCAECTNRTCKGACPLGVDIQAQVTRVLDEFCREKPQKQTGGYKPGRDYIGVGVGAVILRDNRVLLLLRKKAPEADCWSIPGGKVEFGETTEEAVLREVLEELGVEGKITAPLGVTNQILPKEGIHYIAPRYLVTIIGEPVNMEEEKHTDMQWFPLDALPENVTMTTRMALAGLATWRRE